MSRHLQRLRVLDVRDPDHPCLDFEEAPRDPGAVCMTDGHYLCQDCRWRSPETDFQYRRPAESWCTCEHREEDHEERVMESGRVERWNCLLCAGACDTFRPA